MILEGADQPYSERESLRSFAFAVRGLVECPLRTVQNYYTWVVLHAVQYRLDGTSQKSFSNDCSRCCKHSCSRTTRLDPFVIGWELWLRHLQCVLQLHELYPLQYDSP
jgi:hypothetical protein